MSAQDAAAAGASTMLSWFDKVVEAVPNDQAKLALTAARGSVGEVIQSGTALAAPHAEQLQRVTSDLRSGLASLPSSALLSNGKASMWLVLPGISACIGAHHYFQARAHAAHTVPSIEAGEDMNAPKLTDRIVDFFGNVQRALLSVPFHSKQMLLHGAGVCFAVYVLRFVLPAPDTSGSTDADSIKLTSTLKTVVGGVRQVAGLAPARVLPAAAQRLLNCTVRADLVWLLRGTLLGYVSHSVVSLYAERTRTAVSRKVVHYAHIGSTLLDLAIGLWAPFAGSLPPIAKLIATGVGAHAVHNITAANSKFNFDDPLRVTLSTLSLVKSLAMITASTYGVACRGSGLPKLLSLVLVVPLMNAAALTCAKKPATRPVCLANVFSVNMATNLWTLFVFRRYKRGAVAPQVTLSPLLDRAVSLAGLLTALDTVVLTAVIGYQLHSKTYVACSERVVRVPIDPAVFQSGPSPTDAVGPEEVAEWEKEYDFANKTEKNMSQQ